MRANVSTSLVLMLALGLALAPPLAAETTPERWLHVQVVESGEDGETVRVNVPLSVAEKVLPAIYVDKLQGGKLKLREIRVQEVDSRAVLEALRAAPDKEFVTVESKRETVRVAKQGGYLIVKVREHGEEEGGQGDQVDVKVPFTVLEALLSAGEDELDLVAGLRALAQHEDTALVTVKEPDSHVRVWIDSRSTMD